MMILTLIVGMTVLVIVMNQFWSPRFGCGYVPGDDEMRRIIERQIKTENQKLEERLSNCEVWKALTEKAAVHIRNDCSERNVRTLVNLFIAQAANDYWRTITRISDNEKRLRQLPKICGEELRRAYNNFYSIEV